MSSPSGFVITVSCEDFFKDARKSVALFFSQERMKTVLDLKQRIRMLVNTDFYLLWGPNGEEDYYYLLDDEKLHFVKPRDKFRICKITQSFPQQFKQDACVEGQVPKERKENEQKNASLKTNEVLEDSKDDDLLMEYEDVVDEGSKKKRKRTRKHKSKRQKVEESLCVIDMSNEVGTTEIDTSISQKIVNNANGKNHKSHIRFEIDSSNHDQVDTEQQIETIKEDRNFENDKRLQRRKEKKSKEKNEKTLIITQDHLIEGFHPKTSKVKSLNFSETNFASSTASNTPTSARSKANKRKPMHSLASFICHLKESFNTNGPAHQTGDVSMTKNGPLCTLNTTEEQLTPMKTDDKEIDMCHKSVVSNVSPNLSRSEVQTSNRFFTPSNKTSSPNVNSKVESISTDRKLRRNLQRPKELHKNGTQLTVLENLQQLKNSNFPNMPLVFERNFPHDRNPINEIKVTAGNEIHVNGIEETASIVTNQFFDTSMNEKRVTANPVSNRTNVTTENAMNASVRAVNVVANGINESADNVANGFLETTKTIANNISTTDEILNGTKVTGLNSAERAMPVSLVFEQVKDMPEEDIAKYYPPLKEPKEDTGIIFKVLKMDASYNPSLSSYVGAHVKSICLTTKQLSLQIFFGSGELKPPKGKFSLDIEENDPEDELIEYSINWNEMYDTRDLSCLF